MRKDQYNDLAPALYLGPAVVSADNTPAAFDLQGYGACTIFLCVGIGGITFSSTNKIEFVLTHSDDDVTYTAVTDDDIVGVTGIVTGIVKSLVVAHAAAAVYPIGYVGGKRYLKLLADFSGTHGTGTPLALLMLKGEPELKPVY